MNATGNHGRHKVEDDQHIDLSWKETIMLIIHKCLGPNVLKVALTKQKNPRNETKIPAIDINQLTTEIE